MSNIKYTIDGKKVVVIGDLNQTDKIVQEIFITENGDEIPSGDRFVTRGLLDTPCKSWKEKNIEQIEKDYESKIKEWENKINAINKEKRKCYEVLKNEVKWLKDVAKQPLDKQIKEVIQTMTIFLSDTPKWVFIMGYNWNIYELNEELYEVYDGNINFRLLSLYGRTDGNICWKTNRWSDGSGSESDGIQFFDDYDKAISYAQNYLNGKDKYSDNDIEKAEKLGLKLNDEILKAKKEEHKTYIENSIKKYKEEIIKYENELLNMGMN